MNYKIIFTIFDGLGDRPINELGGKTPLEAAECPNLDKLAKLGINGLMHTTGRSVRPGSDVSHLSLLGYNPHKYYRGRGVFEAAGIEMDLQPGDIALRANVATVDKRGIIKDRRAGRIDDTTPYAKRLDGMEISGVTIRAKPGVGHRMVLVLRGEGLSDEVTDVDPHKPEVSVLQAKPVTYDKKARKTASVINELVKKAGDLFAGDNSPVNTILLRGAGQIRPFPSFQDQYGLKAACVAGGGLYKGIASVVGMDILDVEGATGKPDTNIVNKVAKVHESLPFYDFIFLHLKGTDSCAEDGDFQGKKAYIQRADVAFETIVEVVSSGSAIAAVTADHSTICRLKAHTADPVPILIAGADVRVDAVSEFGERAAVSGGLSVMEGLELMPFLVNLLGQQSLYGN